MSFLQNTQVARNEPERFTRRVGRTLWRIGSVLLILTVVLLLILLAARHFTAIGRAVEPDWNWYMTDTHVHSSVSADAFADIGIHSDAAKAHGYDSIFITDHDGGSNFHINRMDANNMRFEDDYTR